MGWKVKRKPDVVKEEQIQCSLCKTPTLYIEPLPKFKLEKLLEKYPHQEWAGYMVGEIRNGDVYVSDLSIPPHEPGSVSGGSAAVDKPDFDAKTGKYIFHIPEKCVGFIHSHDSLGAFHSGTDDAHVDKNYPVSLTVAKRGESPVEMDTVSYTQTPCGKAITGKCKVAYLSPKPQFDIDDWMKDAVKNIEKGTYRAQRTFSGAYAHDFTPEEQRVIDEYSRKYSYPAENKLKTESEGIQKSFPFAEMAKEDLPAEKKENLKVLLSKVKSGLMRVGIFSVK